MRAAIFVDAGYLYAAGSSAIGGQVRFVAARSSEELDLIAKLTPNAPIPQELDGALLWTCGSRLNRWLEEPEKHYVRNEFRERAKNAQAES